MTTVARRVEHVNRRPSWECRVCDRPWPCANAKADLLAEFAKFPSVLAIYLSAQMCDAVGDLASHQQPVPEDLHERFLSWARSPNVSPQVPVRSRRLAA